MNKSRASRSSGRKIVGCANVVYFILGLLTLFVSAGVFYMTRSILILIMILASGLVQTFIVYRLMRGFGEMVQNTAEIADMLEESLAGRTQACNPEQE